ncbi:stage V sporulation protein AB [Oceanobacillus kimchii]|uniref:stage V sporulation protein AB n=1 Tax=Oceanobacillus kimchii TaxID=746691 RepID=UPI00034CC98B|nr:stage V sporulation protein AB [Oceanobacillus kimchii]MCT1575990.1 stage V sporulation protein AB [Oceanobacillus kimchii]MCT2135627.1 stage V sporulation protein AB [Oceanobacillus kimchii]
MIQEIFLRFLQVFIGFSGGLAVGAGFVAFITVLGIIPRLVQLSKSEAFTKAYGGSVIFGLLIGTYFSFASITLNQTIITLLFWGLLHGIFNGMLAAALTEVLNVFPILTRRIGMDKFVYIFMMALLLGKVFGSLFQWIVFVR